MIRKRPAALRDTHSWLALFAATVAFLDIAGPGMPAHADDWPVAVGGNPARNGQSEEYGPTAGTILWQGSRNGIVSQQAVAADDLLVINRINTFDIPTGTFIVAHDLFTGDERWAIRLPDEFGDSWRSRVTGFHDGQVYASRSGNTNAEYLYALDPADGSIIWRSEDLITETSTESVTFAPNGDIITSGQSSILRIDSTDGTTVWESSRSCPTSGGCEPAVFGDTVYIFEQSPDGPVISAFDLATGANRYESPGLGGLVQQVGPFVGPDGTVYAPRTQNNVATDFLVAFEDTGAALVEKWRVALGYVPFASFAVGPDGSVYTYQTTRVGDDTELTILRLDPNDGSVLDSSATLMTDFPASPRIAVDRTGILYFTNGGFDLGKVSSFNPDLTERWSEDLFRVNVGGPVLAENGVMVVSGVGTDVRAYRTDRPLQLQVENLVAGERARFGVGNGLPGEKVAILWSQQSGMFDLAIDDWCISLDLKVTGNPLKRLVAQGVFNGSGIYIAGRNIPQSVRGLEFRFQAAESETCPFHVSSNVVIETVQ